jgi:hypothetical protein
MLHYYIDFSLEKFLGLSAPEEGIYFLSACCLLGVRSLENFGDALWWDKLLRESMSECHINYVGTLGWTP